MFLDSFRIRRPKNKMSFCVNLFKYSVCRGFMICSAYAKFELTGICYYLFERYLHESNLHYERGI